MGVLTHVKPVPRVTGSELVAKILTKDAEGLLGAKFFLSSDPKEAAEIIVRHIDEKRKVLGI